MNVMYIFYIFYKPKLGGYPAGRPVRVSDRAAGMGEGRSSLSEAPEGGSQLVSEPGRAFLPARRLNRLCGLQRLLRGIPCRQAGACF